jgi:hypothetical protein
MESRGRAEAVAPRPLEQLATGLTASPQGHLWVNSPPASLYYKYLHIATNTVEWFS